jgi:hypothetical protein
MLARNKVDKIADYVCQTFRLAFPEENFELPPIYFFDSLPKKENICFESLLIPQVSNLYFGSRSEANDLRESGLIL